MHTQNSESIMRAVEVWIRARLGQPPVKLLYNLNPIVFIVYKNDVPIIEVTEDRMGRPDKFDALDLVAVVFVNVKPYTCGRRH